MHNCKLCEQQDIKLVKNQTIADARTAALETKLKIYSHSKKGDVKKKKGETPKLPVYGRNKGNSVLTCQATEANYKKPS